MMRPQEARARARSAAVQAMQGGRAARAAGSRGSNQLGASLAAAEGFSFGDGGDGDGVEPPSHRGKRARRSSSDQPNASRHRGSKRAQPPLAQAHDRLPPKVTPPTAPRLPPPPPLTVPPM